VKKANWISPDKTCIALGLPQAVLKPMLLEAECGSSMTVGFASFYRTRSEQNPDNLVLCLHAIDKLQRRPCRD
jgi:hypothetical protein